MASPWLHIIGMNTSGLASLDKGAVSILKEAECIIGNKKHHRLLEIFPGKKIVWPNPFSTMFPELKKFRHKTVAVIVTGDPLWYSAGVLLSKEWPVEELQFYPQLSAFQLACARMKWNVSEVETLSIHGRPAEQIIPYCSPGNKIVLLTSDRTSPAVIAEILMQKGFGDSILTVLGNMGGQNESLIQGQANFWNDVRNINTIPDFHTLCVDCIPSPISQIIPTGIGLPDTLFHHDGNITKSEVRSITVSCLSPFRNKTLWDLGCGNGSVSVEWLRLSPNGKAFATEIHPERCNNIKENAKNLGAIGLEVHNTRSEAVIDQFPNPDSIFIGGGLEYNLVKICIDRLRPHGRMVINTITLESEAQLVQLQKEFGGELVKLAISRQSDLGKFSSWNQHLPVTQWRFVN